MEFGINTYLFASPFTNQSCELFPLFKSWGFDFVEIAVEDVALIDPLFVRNELIKSGLKCKSICAATGPGKDLRGNKKEQLNAIDYIRQLIDIAEAVGSKLVAGPIYSAVGRAELYSDSDKQKQRKLVVGNLQILAEAAEQKAVKLALEPLNRYETDMINTCAQALDLIGEVGSDALQVHLDTFHMNLEEKDPAKAILLAEGRLGLLHASGSDRGTPGGDQINWINIFTALKDIEYQGDIVIESFTPDVKSIAKAASIWRQVEPSKEAIATEGLKFLKSLS